MDWLAASALWACAALPSSNVIFPDSAATGPLLRARMGGSRRFNVCARLLPGVEEVVPAVAVAVVVVVVVVVVAGVLALSGMRCV